MNKQLPVLSQPYVFYLPDNVTDDVGALHTLLADLGIQGVTRQDGTCYVAFTQEPPPNIRGEIMRRLKARKP